MDIERRLEALEARTAEIEGQVETLYAAQQITAERVKDLHDLFLRESVTGRPPLAKSIQELLTVYNSARWAWRATMYLAAAATTIFAAWSALQSFILGPR